LYTKHFHKGPVNTNSVHKKKQSHDSSKNNNATWEKQFVWMKGGHHGEPFCKLTYVTLPLLPESTT